jgi:hypothetical protein
MRTTLVLDDALLRQARRRAVERNMTVSEVVNEALRRSLSQPDQTAPPFTMITYGRPGDRVRHEPADLAHLLEREEQEHLR